VFKSQDMSRRSKYIVAIIVFVQPFTQILNLMYFTGRTDSHFYGFKGCFFPMFSDVRTVDSLRVWLEIVIPFAVITTFNLATITVLCRRRCGQHTVSGSRDHVHVFTKITIMTGVSFVMSYSLELGKCLYVIFILDGGSIFTIQKYMGEGMLYFNSCMNPIICLVVCRSMHDDMKSSLMAVIRRVRRSCAIRCSHPESATANTSQTANSV